VSTFVAFCDNPTCGAIFLAPNIIGGAGSATLSMTGTRYGPCPRCGGNGHIPDGVYRYANHVVEFLRGPQESLAALRKVEALLRTVQSQSPTRDELLNQVRAVAPGVAGAMEKAPTVAVTQQWIQILLAFVTLAILVQTTYFKKSDKELENKFIEHLLQENKELKPQKQPGVSGQPIRRASPKVPRNAPCTCGSGKKYKRCCGA
jgi:SEC-C motif